MHFDGKTIERVSESCNRRLLDRRDWGIEEFDWNQSEIAAAVGRALSL